MPKADPYQGLLARLADAEAVAADAVALARTIAEASGQPGLLRDQAAWLLRRAARADELEAAIGIVGQARSIPGDPDAVLRELCRG